MKTTTNIDINKILEQILFAKSSEKWNLITNQSSIHCKTFDTDKFLFSRFYNMSNGALKLKQVGAY